MLVVSHGNLLEAEVDALVNTVNTQGVMGKGIALQFKRAFPDYFKAYEKAAKSHSIDVGRVHVYEAAHLVGGPRFIINFPTKKHWRNPSRIEWIEEGLNSLVAEVRRLGIRSLALPPLGCGNGGLRWSDVLPLIERAATGLPDVRVLVYPPEGAPPAAQMPVRTDRPDLTVGRAGLISLVRRYMSSGLEDSVTLLEIQKLMYFLQEAGQALQLKFVAHHYGPYADNLRHVLGRLEGHYLQGFADGQVAPETELTLLPGAIETAEQTLRPESEVHARFERVGRLIDGFETPFGMELLATVHWVAMKDDPPASSPDEAIAAVRHWNTRKAMLMRPAHVRSAWNRLESEGWLATAK